MKNLIVAIVVAVALLSLARYFSLVKVHVQLLFSLVKSKKTAILD